MSTIARTPRRIDCGKRALQVSRYDHRTLLLELVTESTAPSLLLRREQARELVEALSFLLDEISPVTRAAHRPPDAPRSPGQPRRRTSP